MVALAALLLMTPAADPPPGDAREDSLPLTSTPDPGRPPPVLLSPDGGRLLVADYVLPNADRSQRGLATQLVLIDLTAGRVMANVTLPDLAAQLGMDAHHVYVGLNDADALLVLAADTLTQTRRLELPGRAVDISTDPDQVTIRTAGAGGPVALSVPGLRRVDPPRPADGATTDPVQVFTADLMLTASLKYSTGLAGLDVRRPEARRFDARRRADPLPADPLPAEPWGVRLRHKEDHARSRGTHLLGAGDRMLGSVPPAADAGVWWPASAVLAGRPLVATGLRRVMPRADGAAATPFPIQIEVVYQNLTTTAEVARQTVGRGEARLVKNGHGPQPPPVPVRLLARPSDELVLLVGHTLYLVRPPVVAGPLPEPLRVLDHPPAALVAGGRPGPLPLPAVRGGAAPLDFDLRPAVPGLTIDRATGAVTAHPQQLIDMAIGLSARDAVLMLANASMPAGVRSDTPAAERVEAAVAKYRRQVADMVVRQTGFAPVGFPVWVPVRIEVRDAQLAPLTVAGGLYVDVPTARLVAVVGPRLEQLLHKPSPARPPVMPTVAPPVAAPPDPELAAFKVRVQALELRLDELNRKLDAVLKALEPKKEPDKK